MVHYVLPGFGGVPSVLCGSGLTWARWFTMSHLDLVEFYHYYADQVLPGVV